MFRGEDGRFFPVDRLEVWFNTKVPTSQVPNAEPIGPGPILHPATVDDMERCTFSTHFTVPDVGPGGHKISVFVFYEGGYGMGLSHFLTAGGGLLQPQGLGEAPNVIGSLLCAEHEHGNVCTGPPVLVE